MSTSVMAEVLNSEWYLFFVQAFHYTCCHGQPEIAELLMKKSSEFKIELNNKDNWGRTGFHWACWSGEINIVEMIIDQSEALKIDLIIKDNEGKTGLQLAQGRTVIYHPYEYALTGRQKANDVVDLIKFKKPSIFAVESGQSVDFGHIGPMPFSLTADDIS